MATFLAAAIVFGLAFLAMALSVIRGKRCSHCSCKAADKIVNGHGKRVGDLDLRATGVPAGCGNGSPTTHIHLRAGAPSVSPGQRPGGDV